MPDLVRRWTREEVLALPDDGNRYDLFDGELLVTPAPSGLHQIALVRLFSAITGSEASPGSNAYPVLKRRLSDRLSRIQVMVR